MPRASCVPDPNPQCIGISDSNVNLIPGNGWLCWRRWRTLIARSRYTEAATSMSVAISAIIWKLGSVIASPNPPSIRPNAPFKSSKEKCKRDGVVILTWFIVRSGCVRLVAAVVSDLAYFRLFSLVTQRRFPHIRSV